MIDFPNSPTPGQIYNSGTGPIYIWDGVAWSLVTQATATAESRNRVINPAMQIGQEWGTASTFTNGSWAADQWCCAYNTSTGATVATQREPAATPTPYGSLFRHLVVPTVADTSLATGEFMMTYQPIEGVNIADLLWGTANAKQVILRFGCRAPAGTYAATILNAADTRSFIAMFTIAAGQANTDTIQTIIIPGDTTGTWATDNTVGLTIQFGWAFGATYRGGVAGWQAGPNKWATSAISNGMAVANASFYIFDVGLYADPNKTGVPPPFIAPVYANALIDCQRYYEKASSVAVNALTYGQMAWKVTKRTGPSTSFILESGSGAGFTAYTWNLGTTGFYQFSANSTICQAVITANARM